VALQLMRNFTSGDYAVISNVLIPYSGRIGTSQIDHIVVSIYGIFCIETKSHKGWILGSKARGIFTQVLYRNKYPIVPNPVTQNETHINALKELLGNKVKAPIVNIVVFPSADKFIMDGYENVGSMNDLYDIISSRHGKVYLYKEAKEIIDSISKANMKHPEVHAYHARHVRNVYASRSLV
jgi:restriction system protein